MKCKECKFFGSFDQCHRYPPQLCFDEDGVSTASGWPSVDKDDWCGEFKNETW